MSARRPVLLLIDDEDAVREVVETSARRADFELLACADHEAALRLVEAHRAEVALAGLRIPGADATDLLRAVRRIDASCQVVVMGEDRSPDTAIGAIRLGALDYLVKPLDERRVDELLAGLRHEITRRQYLLAREGDVARHLEFMGMVGRAPAMQDLFSLVRRLALHVRVALVTGETGTGKGLVARALHGLGPWRAYPITAISCAALAAPGPARATRSGWGVGPFDGVPSGTLLLDDVSDLPPGAQDALLRFLEAGAEATAGGEAGPGLQVVAATARDLRRLVDAGRFRRDLLARLARVRLHVPALRDRREDIPYLAAQFVREFSREFQRPLRGLTVGAERYLVSAPWPGNVRELRNVLERACLLAEGSLLTEREVADGGCEIIEGPGNAPASPGPPGEAGWARQTVEPLATMERDCVLNALRQAAGNKKLAARLLGLSRRAFYRRLERHQLDEVIHRRPGRPGARVGTAAVA